MSAKTFSDGVRIENLGQYDRVSSSLVEYEHKHILYRPALCIHLSVSLELYGI